MRDARPPAAQRSPMLPMTPTSLLLLLPLLLSALAACGSKNRLDGSISEAFDLTFNSVQVHRSPQAMEVSYLRSHAQEVVIRLTVVLEGLDVSKGGRIDLATQWSPGHPRLTVTRAIDNEPIRHLPDVVRGELALDGDPVPGRIGSGEFSMAFGDNGDLGAGRTLEGEFSAMVQGTAY